MKPLYFLVCAVCVVSLFVVACGSANPGVDKASLKHELKAFSQSCGKNARYGVMEIGDPKKPQKGSGTAFVTENGKQFIRHEGYEIDYEPLVSDNIFMVQWRHWTTRKVGKSYSPSPSPFSPIKAALVSLQDTDGRLVRRWNLPRVFGSIGWSFSQQKNELRPGESLATVKICWTPEKVRKRLSWTR